MSSQGGDAAKLAPVVVGGELPARSRSVGSVAPLDVLLVSTPIGTLGSGAGGGVELTLANAARSLRGLGSRVTVMAARGSRLPDDLADVELVEVAGDPPPSAQHQGRDAPVLLSADTLVGNFFETARARQGRHDVIVNFGYDWLPLYLTPFFETPLCHLIGMGSVSDAVERAAGAVARYAPARIAMHTRAQASTYGFGDQVRIVGNGFDLARYRSAPTVERAAFAWVGRIAPEKGLPDAVAAVLAAGGELRVFGIVADEEHWQAVLQSPGGAVVRHRGFLPTEDLAGELARCEALVMTPKWDEAFGNVVIEALACGVPVITYRRGGPAELVDHGRTGLVVEPDSIDELASALARVGSLDRSECRRAAERSFSLDAFGRRLVDWLGEVRRSDR